MSKNQGTSLFQHILALASTAKDFCFLDGGSQNRGWLGLHADYIIRATSLAAIAEVEALWRRQPQYIWMGFLTYEVGVEALLKKSVRSGSLPGLLLKRYPAACELESHKFRLHGDKEACHDLANQLATPVPSQALLSQESWPLQPLCTELSETQYMERILRVKDYIAAGDSYQVNLSQRFHSAWQPSLHHSFNGGDMTAELAKQAASIFYNLQTHTPAPMAAMIHCDRQWILSNSPETLFNISFASSQHTATLQTWPIKGTRPRGLTPFLDEHYKQELQTSDKDRAEHVMIVDLLRNDLGRIATAGSVCAPRSPQLITLPTVHHLVSEISCQLPTDWSLYDVCAALLPGGSVTGAPKRRAVEIINELEDHARTIYCGTILVLTPNGIRASIPIRTGVLSTSGLCYWSGGGIVSDSDPQAELQETWTKALAFQTHKV